jgi:hypothetical protein
MAVMIGSPSHFHTIRKPHMSVLRIVAPVAVIIEIVKADNVV